MESRHILFSNGRIHYSVFGDGPASVIAFHGFGQDGSIFKKVAKRLPEYRIIAVDLPFHGKSVLFDEEQPIKPHQVIELVNSLIKTEKIGRFSILAFSIGARFVWPLLNCFYEQIESVTLLAPDGLPTSRWYRLATFSKTSRWVFRQVMENERIISGIIRTTRTLGITDQHTSLYLQKTVETAEMRNRIYNTWTALRFLKPDLTMMAKMISNGKKVQIVLAEMDRLIDSTSAIRKLSAIQGLEIVVLPCQHHRLLEKFTDWYMQVKKETGD